jgi:hypothetical protein
MTPRKAKKLSIEIWTFLSEHPECDSKYYLPTKLLKKVDKLPFKCPLCALFYEDGAICLQCPLKRCNNGSDYGRWERESFEGKKKHATKILEAIKAWEP